MPQPGKGSAGKPNYSTPISDKGEAKSGSIQAPNGAGPVPSASVPGKGTKGTGKSF